MLKKTFVNGRLSRYAKSIYLSGDDKSNIPKLKNPHQMPERLKVKYLQE